MGACVYGRNPTGRFMVILLDVAECLKDKQNGEKKKGEFVSDGAIREGLVENGAWER